MPTINVDDEVIALLSSRGKFGDTFNDLVRDALGLPRVAINPEPSFKPRGALAPLVDAGLLHDGQVLTWYRRNLGKTHNAAVSADGFLVTSDGRSYTSPDALASALAGHACRGWTSWRTADGTRLHDLRERLAAQEQTPDTDT